MFVRTHPSRDISLRHKHELWIVLADEADVEREVLLRACVAINKMWLLYLNEVRQLPVE